jgi:endogenous inhibitor of DNA gyrase (YacG/DUF329 family)
MKRKPIGEAKKAKFEKRHCLECGEEFQAKRKWHDFCSKNCRINNWKNRNIDPSKIAELERRIIHLEKKVGISSNAK